MIPSISCNAPAACARGMLALLSLSALPAADHWARTPDVWIMGIEAGNTPPSIPAGTTGSFVSAALPALCIAFSSVLNRIDGVVFRETFFQQIEADAQSSASHYGKGWIWKDCSSAPPNQIFKQFIEIERTHYLRGNANNYRFSNGFARTYLRSYFNVVCDTDPIGNQDGEAVYRHEGSEGSAAPTGLELNITWPPGLTLVWDTAGTDEWADSWEDDPATSIVEPGQISTIDRRPSNNGHPYIYVDITMEARSQTTVRNYGFQATATVKTRVNTFTLDK